MLPTIAFILWVFALVFFILATVGIPSPPRFNFMAAGLACIALAAVITRALGLS